MSSAVQAAPARNQAINALVLGIAAIVLAFLVNAPGVVSYIGLLSPVAALLAVIAGLRALGRASGQQRMQALVGILAAIVGVILFVVFLSSSVNSFMKTLGPQSFKGNGLQLTYPGSWTSVETSQVSTCKQTGITCVFFVGQADGTNLNIIQTTLPQASPVDAAQIGQQIQASMPNAHQTSQDTLTIGGQPAVRFVFDAPSTVSGSSGHNYIVQVYVANGTSLYTITGLATSADALSSHRTDIDSIISSITFTS